MGYHVSNSLDHMLVMWLKSEMKCWNVTRAMAQSPSHSLLPLTFIKLFSYLNYEVGICIWKLQECEWLFYPKHLAFFLTENRLPTNGSCCYCHSYYQLFQGWWCMALLSVSHTRWERAPVLPWPFFLVTLKPGSQEALGEYMPLTLEELAESCPPTSPSCCILWDLRTDSLRHHHPFHPPWWSLYLRPQGSNHFLLPWVGLCKHQDQDVIYWCWLTPVGYKPRGTRDWILQLAVSTLWHSLPEELSPSG